MFEVNTTKDFVLEFIKHNTEEVKKLLDEKGFGYDKSEFVTRASLLHTEVAELTDAVKKGKGNVEEGSEVADIIIRSLNFTCMFPNLIPDEDTMKVMKSNFHLILEEEDKLKAKYRATYQLHSFVKELCELLETCSCIPIAKDEAEEQLINKMAKDYLRAAIAFLSSIIVMCDLYCKNFLDKILQELVDEKMSINHARPYRYNTSGEHFK